MRTRAYRRAQRQRMMDKARRKLMSWTPDQDDMAEVDRHHWLVSTHADNMRKCSCWMCKSGRGKPRLRVTTEDMQEYA